MVRTQYYLLLLIICHIKVTRSYLFDLFPEILKISMPIHPVCHILKLMPQHPLAVIFCNLIFFAEIGKGMPTIMRGVVLPDPDGWQKLVHICAEGAGRLRKQLSIALYPCSHHFPDCRMDGDDASLTSPALVPAMKIPFGCVHLYFTVFFDAESGQKDVES